MLDGMRPPLPLPPQLGTAFSRAEGLAAGLTPKQLRHPALAIPFRRIRIVPQQADDDGEPDPFADPVADALRALSDAYARALPEGVHLSHSSAAVLHGIPLPRRAFAQLRGEAWRPLADRVLVEASTPRPGRAPRGPRVRGHQSVPALQPVMTLGRVLVATPAATWASLAGRLDVDELVAIGDAIVRIPRIPGPFGRVLRAPLATFDDLDAVIRSGRRVGIVKLREARALVRVGSASPKETELRCALTAGTALPAPVLDFDVYARGVFLGCSEIAYPEYQVAVEYEGDYHRTDRRRWAKDIDKYQAYAEAGWRVVQITAEHLRRTGEPARRVRTALRQAGWSPGLR